MLTAAQIAAIIMLLQAFGTDAQTIAVVQAELQPGAVKTSVSVSPIPSSVPSTHSYSTYVPISVAQYIANPVGYLGEQVAITGMVNTLMPRTLNGATNYIQVTNPFDLSQPRVQLEIDDNAAYGTASNSLQDQSSPILQFVQAYGTAVGSKAFTMTAMFGSQAVMLPVVNVTRVDKCLHGSMNTTVLTGSSLDDNFKCTTWTTIAGQ